MRDPPENHDPKKPALFVPVIREVGYWGRKALFLFPRPVRARRWIR